MMHGHGRQYGADRCRTSRNDHLLLVSQRGYLHKHTTGFAMGKIWQLPMAAALLLLVAACAPEPALSPPEPSPPKPEAMNQPRNAQPGLDTTVEAAITDLAGRLDIDANDITVQSARAVTWSDGAIGCPMPEHAYTQALVEGFHVELEADGETHHYHAGRDGAPFRCPDDRRRAPIDDRRAVK